LLNSKRFLTASVLAIFVTSSGISTSHAHSLTLIEDDEPELSQNESDSIDHLCNLEAVTVGSVVGERDHKYPLDQVLNQGHEDFERQRRDLSECDGCGPSITREEDRYIEEVRAIYAHPELGSRLLSGAAHRLCVKEETSFSEALNEKRQRKREEWQREREERHEEFERELDQIR
jgi:hypothetical protein